MTINKKLLELSKWEYLVPALAIISLLISCISVSSKKFFWNDELYSYYLLADQSFNHMMVAFSDKINNTPPLYFILGWFWSKIFGSTELSLRLFSSLGICIACATVWITLRRTYTFWSASIGTVGVFCTSDIILSQNAEARMYGLFLAVSSLGILLFDVINKNPKFSQGLILVNTCINVAIVLTHLFGIFYSAAILFAFLIRDLYFKTFRPKIYLSIILSWLSLILYIPSFLIQADAGNPRSWISIPSLADLFNLLNLSSSSIFCFVFLSLIVISVFQFLFKANDTHYSHDSRQQNSLNFNAEVSLLILAFTFLIVPVFVWTISRTIKPIFWDRYMIPSTLSWSILLAYFFSCIIFPISYLNIRVFINSFLPNLSRMGTSILLLSLAVILIINPIRYANKFPKEQLPGLNDDQYGYRDLPIVTQFSHDFVKRFHYSPKRHRYFFILDWQVALDNGSGRFPPQEYKHMDALKRNYPELFQNNIALSKDFLNMYSTFLVLDYVGYDKKCTLEDFYCPRWLEMRIMNNPNYKVTALGDIQDGKLLLVERK